MPKQCHQEVQDWTQMLKKQADRMLSVIWLIHLFLVLKGFFWRFWREFWRAHGSRLNSSSLTLIYLMNWRQNKRVSIDDVDVVVKRCISCGCAHFKSGHWTPSLVCDVCATLGFCLDVFGDFSIALIRSFSAGRPSGTVRAASANKCHGNVIR